MSYLVFRILSQYHDFFYDHTSFYEYFQLSNIIKTRGKHGLHTDNILAFLVHIYALAGTEIQFSLQQEQQLKEAIADAVFEDITKLKGNTTKTSMYQQSLSLLG